MLRLNVETVKEYTPKETNSNTTNVKVKFLQTIQDLITALNSNTTNVKVKYRLLTYV